MIIYIDIFINVIQSFDQDNKFDTSLRCVEMVPFTCEEMFTYNTSRWIQLFVPFRPSTVDTLMGSRYIIFCATIA